MTLMGVVAGGLSVIIAFRCIRVIHNMDLRHRSVSYWRWALFGLSYAVTCIAALGAAAHIIENHGNAGDWMWLSAGAGLILFDRRKRRRVGG